ncbi:oligosaccharide flippase family protein [Paenibacillus sp. FSL R7-0337]|uniref:lipopolysaccharide biosynthesis protein n=1 Tax=Paenibacillus sp. FSL R7-0337 TaxID=1926588 RepID=UPI0030DAE7E5
MIKKGFYKSDFLKSIIQLTTGSLLAQLITIVVSPISTRLYTPEQLGIYSLILTITSVFGPIICGKYDLAIVSAKSEKEVANLILSSAIFALIFSFIISIGYSVYLNNNITIVNEVGVYAYVIILILLVNGLINIASSYNNRQKEYKIISSVYVTRSFFQNIGLIFFGLLKLGTVGLLISQLVGSVFGLKKQTKSLYGNKEIFKSVKLHDIKGEMIKHINQPLYSMPAHFVNSSSYSILNFFITGLFGMEVFGYYSMSYRMLGLPLSLVSSNVSKVFFQRAYQEKIDTGSFRRTLKNTTLFLFALSVPMVLFLMFFSPQIFKFVFGEKWYMSGVYVKILAPMFGIRLIVSALTPAVIIAGKQKIELLIQLLFCITSIIMFFICKIINTEIYIFLKLISISYSFIYVLFYLLIYKISRDKVE